MEHKEQLLSLFPITNKRHELIPCEDYEIKQEGEKFYLIKKKKEYPKTYKECCDVLGLDTMDNDVQGYKADLIIQFQELLIARDVYWKIAGEEMGLGKPWEPDWGNIDQAKYCLYTDSNNIKRAVWFFTNAILAFPTDEIRAVFYENFKELIEYCKTLL